MTSPTPLFLIVLGLMGCPREDAGSDSGDEADSDADGDGDTDADGDVDTGCLDTGYPIRIDLETADSIIEGEATVQMVASLGWYVEAGDVNGDFTDDAVMISEGYDSDHAHVIYGPLPSQMGISSADAMIDCGKGGDRCDKVDVADVNADVNEDVLLSRLPDKVLVFPGPFFGTIGIDEADVVLQGQGAEFSVHSTSTVDDFSNDGMNDLLITDGLNCDAYILDGPVVSDAVLFSSSDAVLRGNCYQSRLTSSSHDVNGDGITEAIIGSRGFLNEDYVFVIEGPILSDIDLSYSDAIIRTSDSRAGIGASLASGDVDGDGYGDILTGVETEAYLFLGPVSGILSDADSFTEYSFSTWSDEDNYTSLVDFDMDGEEEIVIGNIAAVDEGQNESAIAVIDEPCGGKYSVQNDSDILIVSVVSTFAGYSLSSGTVLGNDEPDLLIGSPGYPGDGGGLGAVLVLSGSRI